MKKNYLPTADPTSVYLQSALDEVRNQAQLRIIDLLKQVHTNDVMLKRCVLFHYVSEEESEFISRVLSDGTVAIDSSMETYYLPFKSISVDMLLHIFKELQGRHFIKLNVDISLPTGVLAAVH